jgi:hypothetical protein
LFEQFLDPNDFSVDFTVEVLKLSNFLRNDELKAKFFQELKLNVDMKLTAELVGKLPS